MTRMYISGLLATAASFLLGLVTCLTGATISRDIDLLGEHILRSTRGSLPGYVGKTSTFICCSTTVNPQQTTCVCAVGVNNPQACLICDGTSVVSGYPFQGGGSQIQPTGSSADCDQYMQRVGQCNNQNGNCVNQIGNMQTCTGQFMYYTTEPPTG